MSSTNRGGNRDGFDDFPTPEWVTKRFIEAARNVLPPAGRWLEPCAGEGRIIRAVNSSDISRLTIEWHAWEIREHLRHLLCELSSDVRIGDCVQLAERYPDSYFDVAITNPPFIHAMPILLALRRIARIVVLLLRRNFIGSGDRCEYLRQNMPDEYLLPNRPSFVWRHKYILRCTVCGRELTRHVDVPAGQKAVPTGTAWPLDEHCESGHLSFIVKRVSTTRSDSCEYCFCVWTPDSGPVGSTRMLALTPKAER